MDTVQAVSLGRALNAERNLADWQAYAMRLERELKMAKADNFGYAAIKDAAIQQLAKLDPKNYLLIQQNRQKIFDDARNAQLSGKKAA